MKHHDLEGYTPIFDQVCQVWPGLRWHQPHETFLAWDGTVLRRHPIGPLTTD